MIYSKILNPKHKKLFRGLAIMTLLLFSLTINACYTSNTDLYTPEKLKTIDTNECDYDIQKIKLKDGSDLSKEKGDFNNAEITDTAGYLLRVLKIDTTFSNEKKTITQRNYKNIKIEDILRLKVKTAEFSTGNTVLFVAGTIVAAGLIGILIYAACFKFSIDWSDLHFPTMGK